jgi:hypothetical protein
MPDILSSQPLRHGDEHGNDIRISELVLGCETRSLLMRKPSDAPVIAGDVEVMQALTVYAVHVEVGNERWTELVTVLVGEGTAAGEEGPLEFVDEAAAEGKAEGVTGSLYQCQ